MEKFTYKKWYGLLKTKGILAGISGLLLVSCVPMGGYTETDGVYYDPNRDTLPEGQMTNNGNRVGDYYDYQATEFDNQYLNSDNRNQNWNDNQESDWGAFTGTDTYYTNNSWGSPFGFYSGFGFGMGMGFGWGSPWGFGGMYNSWGYGYNPWYGHYSPYFGYYNPYMYGGYYGAYNPYGNVGYGSGFNSYNGGFNYKRSGSDGAFRNSVRTSNNGFRNSNTNNSGFRNTNNNSRINSQNNSRFNQSGNRNQSGIRTNSNSFPRQNTTRQNTPTYQQPNRNDGGGFRSGGSNGGFRSGGFGGGSSSSGGTRSSGGGGFRR